MIGYSMGAEQAFQWAVSYPDFADRMVATSGTAKCYPHGFVRLEGQIAAITTDPIFAAGDYKTRPEKGHRGFWVGLGGLALFAGMVEEGTMAHVEPTRNYLRKDCRELSYALLCERCERPDSAMPDMAATRCWHDAGV